MKSSNSKFLKSVHIASMMVPPLRPSRILKGEIVEVADHAMAAKLLTRFEVDNDGEEQRYWLDVTEQVLAERAAAEAPAAKAEKVAPAPAPEPETGGKQEGEEDDKQDDDPDAGKSAESGDLRTEDLPEGAGKPAKPAKPAAKAAAKPAAAKPAARRTVQRKAK